MEKKKLWIHSLIYRTSFIKICCWDLPDQLYCYGGLTLAEERNLLLIKIE